MAYDTLLQTFQIYSEDFDLIGFRQIEVRGYFEDYPSITSSNPNLSTIIEIQTPCMRPASISAPTSVYNIEYFYTVSGAVFNKKSLLIDPPFCPATFECITVVGTDPGVTCDDPDAISFN